MNRSIAATLTCTRKLRRPLGTAAIRRLALIGALLAASAIATAQQAAPPSPRVTGQKEAAGSQVIINEVNTDTYPKVRVIASVLSDSRPVKGLGNADFRVSESRSEDGVEAWVDQEPLTVEEKKLALSVVITLDTSLSMKEQLKDAQSAAIRFLDTLSTSDSVHVVSFAQEVKHLTRTFSQSREIARAAIKAPVASGNTKLYDALHESLGLFQKQSGRKAIVLLSDGKDDDGTKKRGLDGEKLHPLSRHTVEEVLALARQMNVPIYIIGLGKELDEAVLQQIASDTGGLYFNAEQASDLKKLYAQIGEQLAGQYSISYTSNLPPDGKSRTAQLVFLRENIRATKDYVTPKGVRVDLFARGQKAEILVASSDNWKATIDGKEEKAVFSGNEWAVYGFKDGNSARFDLFSMLIPGADVSNIAEFELLVANDSPSGEFQSVGKFKTQNAKMLKAPYQEVTFPPVTAKYLKFQILSVHGGRLWKPAIYEFKLLGELLPFVEGSKDRPGGAIQVQGKNVLAAREGGEVLVASNDNWKATIDGKEDKVLFNPNEWAVYGFKDGTPARFDSFQMLIPGADGTTIAEFELLVAEDSPTGEFQSIGKFKTLNAKMLKSPYQEFKFPAVTAKYLKFQIISTHDGNFWRPGIYEFKLLGELQ